MITTPARRKQFRFQMPPTDNELWAIGAVAVQWSQLESLLLSVFFGLVEPDSEERAVYERTRAFDARLDQLQTLLELRLPEPLRGQMVGIVVRIRNAAQMRDRIMHGTWAGKPAKDDPNDMTSKGVFSWAKPRKPFEWDLDYGKIIYVAKTIDRIIIDLLEAPGGDPNGGFLPIGETLRRIWRKPDPT